MIKLYLDIDGVLLTQKLEVPEFGPQFIDFVVLHFDCYWLTTHCKGNAQTSIQYLSQFYSDSKIDLLKQVKPTNWNTLKTEALDFFESFLWLDDAPFQSEIRILKEHNSEDNLIKVDLRNQNELQTVLRLLKTYVNK